MNKFYSSLILMVLAFGVNLNAQTIKNIHRHNLPALQIPVDLIDKVQTVEVNGVKNLQITPLLGDITQIPLSEIDSITHYMGSVGPDQLGNFRTGSVMGIVTGPTGAPEMNAIVRSPYGGEETQTDGNGVFTLNNIIVYDKLGYIIIEKPGFHKGSRSFLPLEQGINRVNIQLLPMTLSGSFNVASGGQITSGLLQLSFPPNAIVKNGQPYTGFVSVYAKAIDPSSSEFFDQMPGELMGVMNDTLRLMRSFGMATVELRDANMQLLQLREGISVAMKFTIPPSILDDSPETIDWWSFNETLGYWEQVGVAQKQGNIYTGYATHFSWWNCDVPDNFNNFYGTVNSTDGNPLSDAQVNVVSSTMGTGIKYTNAQGVFSGRVPKNQLLTLYINLFCETTSDWTLALSETITSEEVAISETYTTELIGFYPISGTVVNCEGQPVQSGYVKMGHQIYNTNQGEFTIQTCLTGNYTFRGYDATNPDSIKVSDLVAVQVESSGAVTGNILACTELYGTVTDIDENSYSTVLIGNQWWMTENLKTTRFEDGSVIPNVTDNTAWNDLNTPAWCNYNNSAAYDTLYGKLYNWYTVTDPRNVCPAGWHAPSDDEWTILIDFLGGRTIAGGKMKTTIGWQVPNTGATNESGFSGLPGGNRVEITGEFSNEDISGRWFSTTANGSYNAFTRILTYDIGYCNVDFAVRKKNGLSVRCVKD